MNCFQILRFQFDLCPYIMGTELGVLPTAANSAGYGSFTYACAVAGTTAGRGLHLSTFRLIVRACCGVGVHLGVA
jgi:hypothetical protein